MSKSGCHNKQKPEGPKLQKVKYFCQYACPNFKILEVGGASRLKNDFFYLDSKKNDGTGAEFERHLRDLNSSFLFILVHWCLETEFVIIVCA